MKKYVQFRGNNPFASQAKMLFLIDRLYEYQQNDDCYPSFMELNLTNCCNYKCFWCISENFHGRDTLDYHVLVKFMKEFKEKGGKAVTFSGGGEPTLHPRFTDLAFEAKRIGLDLGLMTNGSFKPEYISVIGSFFNWVRFSVDTNNEKKYKKWKGVNTLKHVRKNIHALNKHNVRVGVNCNICTNHSFFDVIGLIKEFYKDVNYIQFRPVLPRYFKAERVQMNKNVWSFLIFIDKFFSKINISNDKLADIKNENFFKFKKCDGHFFEPVLNANGDLCVCMYHPNDERFIFGNIYHNSFEEIWKSRKRRKVIELIRSLDYENMCQACCKLAEPNKFLDYINNPQNVRDVNFL